MTHDLQPPCLLASVAGICFALTVNTDAAPEKSLLDFSTATNASAWQILNDDVMRGVSTSRFDVTNEVAVFRGEVSLENNGGFASVRLSPVQQNLAGHNVFVVVSVGFLISDKQAGSFRLEVA